MCMSCISSYLFVDERTCSKFFFYAGNDYQGPGGLPDYISKDFIPEFLDGTSKVITLKVSLILSYWNSI